MVHYEVPRLPYDYDALEPYIDEQTMRIHHDLHHKAYADGLNETLKKMSGDAHPQHVSEILMDIQSVPKELQGVFEFFAGGYDNHQMLWESMSPDGAGVPVGKLADSIEVYFGSYEGFQSAFLDKAVQIEGSGWGWLVHNPTFERLEIITTLNQASPRSLNLIPLLGCDVWEHAYYIRYQNRRADYIKAWWNVVNWDTIESRFSQILP